MPDPHVCTVNTESSNLTPCSSYALRSSSGDLKVLSLLNIIGLKKALIDPGICPVGSPS